MTIKTTKNIHFDLRNYSTPSEEFQFAITILAERILLPDGHTGKINLEKGFECINRILKKEVANLQKEKIVEYAKPKICVSGGESDDDGGGV